MRYHFTSKRRAKNFNLPMTSERTERNPGPHPGPVGVDNGTVTLESILASSSNNETGLPQEKGIQKFTHRCQEI